MTRDCPACHQLQPRGEALIPLCRLAQTSTLRARLNEGLCGPDAGMFEPRRDVRLELAEIEKGTRP